MTDFLPCGHEKKYSYFHPALVGSSRFRCIKCDDPNRNSRAMQELEPDRPQKKPCVICGTELECAVDNWDTYQPYKGGEIQLLFGYGSCKFDLNMNGTVFRGIICDDCSEKLVQKMDQKNV